MSSSTIYGGGNHAKNAAPKRTWSKKKLAVIGGVTATFLIPAAAWAAVTLFGFGTFDADAATTQNLTVNNATAHLTGKLVPGATVGAKADVTNPNDFPVSVTGVLVQNNSVAVSPATPACADSVHLIGTAGPTYPGTGGGASTKQDSGAPVTIAPGATVTITVPQSVKQDASATTLCGVHANFAVVAQVGS
jgi:hypothetical protein